MIPLGTALFMLFPLSERVGIRYYILWNAQSVRTVQARHTHIESFQTRFIRCKSTRKNRFTSDAIQLLRKAIGIREYAKVCLCLYFIFISIWTLDSHTYTAIWDDVGARANVCDNNFIYEFARQIKATSVKYCRAAEFPYELCYGYAVCMGLSNMTHQCMYFNRIT